MAVRVPFTQAGGGLMFVHSTLTEHVDIRMSSNLSEAWVFRFHSTVPSWSTISISGWKRVDYLD